MDDQFREVTKLIENYRNHEIVIDLSSELKTLIIMEIKTLILCALILYAVLHQEFLNLVVNLLF